MKKLTLLFAALVLSFTAQATIINGTPNPGEKGRLNWWVNGVVGSTPVTQPGDTIVLADGEYEEGSIDFNKEGLVVMAAEGAKPVIKASSYLKIHATTTFEGITFDGLNTATYAIGSRGTEEKNLTLKNCEFKNYVDCDINIYESTSINKLTIDSCVFYGKGSTSELTITNSEFKNYTEYCITANDYYKGYFEKVSISNSLFHDSKYSAIYLYQATEGNPQSCTDFQLINSTIYNIGNNPTETDLPNRAVVEIRGNSTQQVLVDHVTIYNFPAPDYCGAIKIENSSNATISNCIVMNPDDIDTKWITPFLAYAGATISNSVYYNCNITSSATATQEDLTQADPMFVDAANGNFQLYAESPAIGLGDPRWGVKAGLRPGSGKLKEAVEAAQPGDVIVLGDETYEVSSSIYCDEEGLKIVAAEGTKPVISITNAWASFKLSATITFEGVTFDGNNLANYPVLSSGTKASTYTFNNCEFKNYLYYAISNPYEGGTYVESVIINNCLFHDGGAAVCFNKKGYNENAACNSLKITNSTIYNVSCSEWVGIIHVASNEEATGMQNEVIIDHITMYNFTPNELGGFTSRMSENAQITNSIIANPADNANQYAFRIYGAAEAKNVLYYNTKIEGNNSGCIKEDPLFIDAGNGNFDLYANSLAVNAGTDGKTLGDPRWDVSEKTISTGKRIYVTPDEDLRYYVITDPNVKVGDTLVLANGTYNISSTTEFSKEGLVVMADENAKPEIKLTDTGGYASLKLNNGTTFDGITFNGTGISNYLVIANGTDASKFVFNNCEFKNYVYYAISDPWTDNYDNGRHVDSILINNCLFHDGGAAINLSKYGPEGKHTCDYFEMKNSTIYNISNTGNAAILVSSNAENTGLQNKVVLDHITIYNYANASYGAIAIRKTKDLQITNSIIANPSAGLTAIYHYSEVQNNLFHNVTLKTSDGAAYNAACITADPLFVDAANNNFMLQLASPAIGKATDGSNLGDPRWGVEEPTLITLTTGDNSQVITDNIGKTVNVKIARSFKANDGYYTLCVPFNMPASVIGTVYEIDGIAEYVAGQDGGLSIHLKQVTNLLAGVPYLVDPKENMNELVVEGVIIANDEPSEDYSWNNGMVKLSFQGCYSADGKTDGATEYYIGNGGYLYNNVVDKRGLCGFFTITDNDDNPVNIRARVVTREEVETGIDNNQLPNTNIQKVLENGQLIIIRDGVKYNVQGQKL